MCVHQCRQPGHAVVRAVVLCRVNPNRGPLPCSLVCAKYGGLDFIPLRELTKKKMGAELSARKTGTQERSEESDLNFCRYTFPACCACVGAFLWERREEGFEPSRYGQRQTTARIGRFSNQNGVKRENTRKTILLRHFECEVGASAHGMAAGNMVFSACKAGPGCRRDAVGKF